MGEILWTRISLIALEILLTYAIWVVMVISTLGIIDNMIMIIYRLDLIDSWPPLFGLICFLIILTLILKYCSDHCPMLLEFSVTNLTTQGQRYKRSRKFEQMWLREADHYNIVQTNWKKP
jgi:hypothetical protein